jgi:ribonuclease PH
MTGDSLQNQARELKAAIPLARKNNRGLGESRTFEIVKDFTMYAEGSVLVKSGNTHIICTASVENRVPPFRRGSGLGWVTAEYGMLPRATNTRTTREVSNGKPSGRTSEIQRLIGRSLRSVIDMSVLGEHTIWLDCDVIQADGGTRTAAITGGFVALVLALRELGKSHKFSRPPLRRHVAAVSVGLMEGRPVLDMDYDEDSSAQVDMNLVMTDDLEIIEIQGTAEENPFPRELLNRMLEMAEAGITERVQAQRAALGGKLV